MARSPNQSPDQAIACKICGGETTFAGQKIGCRTGKTFELCRCAACGFAFITNPWLDFASIYDKAYYQGLGSDPLVDYEFELNHPNDTIRRFEWEGITRLLGGLTALGCTTRWLDFGCGNGGLVRHVRNEVGCQIVGFEEGWIADRARTAGISVLDAAGLKHEKSSFDIITAIEVLEHTAEPLEVLGQIRKLLKPGGLFFFTTGNSEPHARNLAAWSYVVPEIHVSFFEPRTLVRALEKTGFRTGFPGFQPGHERIIQFKILKNLRLRRAQGWFRLLPWTLLAKLCDARLGITAHPIAWAR